jgi:hypothetical protein
VINRQRVSNGAMAATTVAVAGGLALAALAVFFAGVTIFGKVSDVASLVMVAALPFVMLAHYELGGVVPLGPARLSLAGGMLAVGVWAVFQILIVAGVLNVDVNAAAAGGWEVQMAAQAVIGLWIAGASLLAGRWLPLTVRLLGIVAGLGVVVMALGIVQGGFTAMLTNVGGVGYQIVLPVWAFLLGRVFRARAAAA